MLISLYVHIRSLDIVKLFVTLMFIRLLEYIASLIAKVALHNTHSINTKTTLLSGNRSIMPSPISVACVGHVLQAGLYN